MFRTKYLVGASWLMALYVGGCEQPGIPNAVPGAVAGGTSAPAPVATTTSPAMTAATAGTMAMRSTPAPGTTTPPMAAAMTTPGSAGAAAMSASAAGTQATPMAAAGAAATPISAAAGMDAAAGSAGAVAAGSGAMEAPAVPPCPSGWTCKDPAASIKEATTLDGQVKDPDGDVIANACAMDGSGQIPCEPAMNGADCPPELTQPICSLITIPGLTDDMPTYNCAQLCNP